jgi:hypothetical protein
MQIRQFFLLLGLVCSFSSLSIHGVGKEQYKEEVTKQFNASTPLVKPSSPAKVIKQFKFTPLPSGPAKVIRQLKFKALSGINGLAECIRQLKFKTLSGIKTSLQYVSDIVSDVFEGLYQQSEPILNNSETQETKSNKSAGLNGEEKQDSSIFPDILKKIGKFGLQKIILKAFSETTKYCFAKVLEIPIKSFNFFYNGAPKIFEYSLLGFVPWVSGKYDEETISLPKRMIFSATLPLTLLVFYLCRLGFRNFFVKKPCNLGLSGKNKKLEDLEKAQHFAKLAVVTAMVEPIKLPPTLKKMFPRYIIPYFSFEKLKKLLPFKGKLLPLRI